MRIARALFPLVLAAACGDDPTVVDGYLADDAGVTHVWVLGEPDRAAVDADSFRIEGVEGELLDLRFAAGDDEVGRMEIRGVQAGERLRLRDIWFDDGVAYPSVVERDGSEPITVNGLLMGGPAAVPSAVDVTATVLAVSSQGDALLARPTGGGMPDLRVVVTPGTSVHTPDGDPAASDELEFGDTVRVVGQGESGFVIATELVLPRSRAGEASRTGDQAPGARFVASPATSAPTGAAAGGERDGRGSGNRAGSDDKGKFDKGKSNDKGKSGDRGKGKGRGRG